MDIGFLPINIARDARNRRPFAGIFSLDLADEIGMPAASH